MIGKTIDQIKVGDEAEFGKTITEADVVLFAGVTGDLNPAHLHETFAADTFFKGRVAHGMLSAGFISAVIGTKLPGPGAIYMSQSLRFTAPVRIGDTVTARVQVMEVIEEKQRVKLSTICTKQDGTVVLEGEALVMAPMRQ